MLHNYDDKIDGLLQHKKIERLTDYYKENFDKLVKRVASRSGGSYNGEDVVQIAFERAIKYLDSYSLDKPIDNWFSRILARSSADFYNTEKHQGMVKDTLEEEVREEGYVVEESKNADYRLIKEDIEKIEDELRRTVLYSYFLLGYTMKEISHVVNAKYRYIDNCIQNYKKQAAKRFRDMSEDYGGSF